MNPFSQFPQMSLYGVLVSAAKSTLSHFPSLHHRQETWKQFYLQTNVCLSTSCAQKKKPSYCSWNHMRVGYWLLVILNNVTDRQTPLPPFKCCKCDDSESIVITWQEVPVIVAHTAMRRRLLQSFSDEQKAGLCCLYMVCTHDSTR